MPRKIDPATIKVGHGLAASDSVEVNAFIPGSGEPGAPAAGGAGAGMVQHIIDEHDAHPASSVSVDDVPKIYDASNVEGVLDELAALVPPRPPTVGHSLHYFQTTSIPDWGILKLDDATWFLRSHHILSGDWCWLDYQVPGPDGDPIPDPDTGLEIYPYFWRSPRGATEFLPKGNDPYTDPIFNVEDGSYLGGGVGKAHAGAFVREKDENSENNRLSMTHEIIPSSGPEGGKEVVVSGVVFPADRGTLALIRFEPNGEFAHLHHPEDFKLRVLAALNLGQGILDKCDGYPGGIFWLGEHGGDCAPHSYDPFTFPGRATGQYNLFEIHMGRDLHGNDLPNEFYDFDGDGSQGAPAAGQVRLGTDPNAGIELIPDGIPILGGSKIARGGGHKGNFFRYRLPYLVDYTKPHGLPWTPPEELYRFYEKPSIAALDPGTDLEHAGDFRSFAKDYWTYQVARYRHQFLLPDDTLLEYDPRDCGHYVLIHFKKEAYFEEMVRDLEMPTQDKMYSANLVDWSHLGSVWNKVRASTDPVHSSCYHVLRSNVYEDVLGDKDSEFCKHPVPPIVDGEGQHDIAQVSWEVGEVMAVSGIEYALSAGYEQNYTTGLRAEGLVVTLKAPDHDATPPVYGLFETSFLTHDGKDGYGESAITGDALYMGNMFPAFLGTSAFTPAADTTVATVGGGEPAEAFQQEINFRRGRIHFGTGHLLSDNASFPVPVEDTVAQMLLEQIDDPALYFDGDTLPKFSQDASLRAFFRRPLNHGRHMNHHDHFFDLGIRIYNYGEGLKDATLLWHGSDHSKDRPNPVRYSNLTDIWFSTPADPTTHEDLWHGAKDPKELFLDETYRYRSDFKAPDGSLPLGLKDTETLCGPGLPHGVITNLHVPIRLEDVHGTAWDAIHWLTSKSHTVPLTEAAQRLELQVAGWPDRNPFIKFGVTDPTPTSGILIYPQHDYTKNYLPTQNSACDYSGIEAADMADHISIGRSWVRAFGLGHDAVGASLVDLEIRGLNLEQFKWEAPEPGSPELAILIKVPGLTSWMDIGRRDGEGPSKQDPFADGAGCMVVGPETKDLTPMPKMGINRCTVRCNLGPPAQLFEGLNGAVILVKVIMYQGGGKYLNFEMGGPTAPPQHLQGLCGIRVAGVK